MKYTLLNQPEMKPSVLNWTEKCKLESTAGLRQLGEPSLPQVQSNLPQGSAFLAKEKPPSWPLKRALRLKKKFFFLAFQELKI